MSDRETEIQNALIQLSKKLNDACALGDLLNLNTEIRSAFLHALMFKQSPAHAMATMDFLDDLYAHVDSKRVRAESDVFKRLGNLLFSIEMTQSKLYGFVDVIIANYMAEMKSSEVAGKQEPEHGSATSSKS